MTGISPRLIYLLQQYAGNDCTRPELDELCMLIREGQADTDLQHFLQQEWNNIQPVPSEVDWNKMYSGILKHQSSGQSQVRTWKRWAVAASIILTLGAGAYFAFFNKERKTEIVKLPESKDIQAPAGTKAVITLADGRQISIDSLNTLDQSTARLQKTADGRIVYTSTADGQHSAVQYNTLSNPRGSKVIDMTLADGSHIWLNAGSSVTYPIAFVGNERKVNITGEAYFEVTASPNPSAGGALRSFIVQKGDMQVQVLGTHFNVNAYDDEADIKVTLIEGSVKVLKGNSSNIIKPGQQARIVNDIKVVNGVDLEQVMAWKNGTFYFNNTNIEVIMREAARWYDVEVTYEGNVKNEFFGGTVPRSENISQLIKALELTKTIKITVEDKKLIIKPAK